MDRDLALIQLQSKSVVLGLILTFFLGGFGLFYIGLIWGLIGSIAMFLLWSIFLFGSIISMGFLAPFIGFIITFFHIIAMIIVAISITNHNKRLIANALGGVVTR